MAERVLAVIAAGLGVVAGVLAVWGVRATRELDEAENTADSVVEQRDELRDQNEQLDGDLEAAQATIEELQAAASTTTTTQPDGTDVTTADQTGTVEPGAAGVYRATGDAPVTFRRNYGIDLDTRDENWGVTTGGGDVSLSMHNDGLSLFIPSRTIALVDERASYDDCEAQTVLQQDFSAELTVVGQKMCMKTSEDRWAFVEIVGLDTARETITLDIVVYTTQSE